MIAEKEYKDLLDKISRLEYLITKYPNSEELKEVNLKINSLQFHLNSLFDEKGISDKYQYCVSLLEKNGLHINEEFNFDNICKQSEWEDWEMETIGFKDFKYYLFYLLSLNGVPYPNRQYLPICNQFWYFDAERDSHVEYGTFIRRLNLMTNNLLDFSEIENILDPRYGVRFKYEGVEYIWNFEYNRDWTDTSFFRKFLGLPNLRRKLYNLKPRFNFYVIPEGQYGIICFLNDYQLDFLCTYLGFKINKL